MKKEPATRKYVLADAVLKQKADEMIQLLERDAPEFGERGYTKARAEEFAAARDAVEAVPGDEQLEGTKMRLTEEKDAARNALEKAMRTILNMAANTFGEGTARYKEFGASNLSRQSDAELVRNAKIMVQTATKYLEELAAEGLKEQRISELSAHETHLDMAIDAQARGISDRDIATEGRIETLNHLYDLVMKYAGIGQDIFFEVDEAKYNDYVIYDTPDGLPGGNAPQPPVPPKI